MKQLLLAICLLLSTAALFAQKEELRLLQGKWVHMEDSLATLEITNDVWLFRYKGDTLKMEDIYRITLKDTVMQTYRSGKQKYLLLTNETDSLEYAIQELNENFFFSEYLPSGRRQDYKKIKEDTYFTRYYSADSSLALDLHCTTDSITGSHCFVTQNGNRIDCSTDENSLFLKKTGKNIYEGILKSHYDDKDHALRIELKGKQLLFIFPKDDHPFLSGKLSGRFLFTK